MSPTAFHTRFITPKSKIAENLRQVLNSKRLFTNGEIRAYYVEEKRNYGSLIQVSIHEVFHLNFDMFIIAEMTKTLRIPPHRFGLKLNEAIAEDLTKTLAGKVIKEVGLCITLFDITSIKESFILPGDGAAHTKVNFRLGVFKPFSEEVILGKIKSCSEEGVRVTLGFFDNIIITPECLQQPCRFDEEEKVWIWEYESEDGKHDLFMDPGEPIRFRVTGNKFTETNPCDHQPGEPEPNSSTEKEKIAPYTITASISEPGLGVVSWWT